MPARIATLRCAHEVLTHVVDCTADDLSACEQLQQTLASVGPADADHHD